MWGVLLEALRGSVLIAGLVVVMMMLIESINVSSSGRAFNGLKKNNFVQVLLSAALGAIPGCVGGFASVSLYTHRMISFGALLAMMIATTGDESFMMLALFPGKAALLWLLLFVLGVVTGLVTDAVYRKGRAIPTRLEDSYDFHDEDVSHERSKRHWGWRRLVLLTGVGIFLFALLSGLLEEEGAEGDLNIFNEKWMYWLFGGVSLIVVAAIIFASDHFVEEHLWHHIVCRHLPSIFAWTFGILLLIGTLFHYVDMESWIRSNMEIVMLLAILIGLIPESGPNLIFVTLYASGVIPFSVLFVNSLVQEGHAGLPLLADCRRGFLKAKGVKVIMALVFFVVWSLFLRN